MFRAFLILTLGIAMVACGDKPGEPATGSTELGSKTSALGSNRQLASDAIAVDQSIAQLDMSELKIVRRKLAPGVSSPKVIIAPDDRVPVADTTAIPWNRVAQVLVGFPGDPGPYRCSGIMIQPTWVLTAAHCLYDPGLGGDVNMVQVIPGLDGSQPCPGAGCPFGVYGFNDTYVPSRWVTDQHVAYDIGLIELDGAPGVGYASWEVASFADLMAGRLYSAGFPGDIPVGDEGMHMYSADDTVHSVTRTLIWNFVDFDPGQSGSGAWQSDRDVVGVMIAGVNFGPGQLYNVAVRLRVELIAWMYQVMGSCANECTVPMCDDGSTYRDCVLGPDNCGDLGPATACPGGTSCINGECFPKDACGRCAAHSDCQTDAFCIQLSGPPPGNPFCTIPCAATPPVCPSGYQCFDLGAAYDPPYQCLPGASMFGEDICEACTPDNCPCTRDEECDDLWFCNGVETCVAGGCAAGTPPVCDDLVDCTDDVCSFVTDECEYTANDANCDDSLYCNGVETCDAVSDCQNGTAVDCDDSVPCTIDTCNEDNDNCDNTPDDSYCDNGAYCDGAETCDAVNNCQDGTAVNCDDSVACTQDICNDTTDSCDHNPDHASCSNGLYCDGAEVCDPVNNCVSGTPPSCNDGLVCTVDACNEDSDNCDHTATDSLCDDSQYCNGAETCHAVNGCQQGTDVDCSDDIACTVDSCNETSDGCDNTPDDSLCTDGNVCTNDSCNASTGCVYTDNDGATCTMGDCTGTCLGGACDGCICSQDSECDDGVACTVDACTSGVCTRIPSNALCDDTLHCTGVETCDAVLGCQAGTAVDCDDGVTCTDDSCNETSDACDNIVNHANCTDADVCDGAEVCDAVLGCQEGVPLDCDDGNACTDDSCDATAGCQHANNTEACDDGNACTMNDACADGACAGEPLDLDDDGYVSDDCLGDDCDDSDADVNPGVDETGAASAICTDDIDNDCDGLIDDQETGCITCVDDAECDDDDPCTDDSCDPATGCVNVDNTAPCDDDDPCTQDDACASGRCLGEPLDEDDDGYSPIECGGYDCDDDNSDVSPEALENCKDGVDNDCNGYVDQDDALCPDVSDNGGCSCSASGRRAGTCGMLLLLGLLLVRRLRYSQLCK